MKIRAIPKGKIELPEFAVKESLHVKAAETALLITDMQNDFVHPDGSLFVPTAPETIPNIKELLNNARSAKAPVVFMQDTHMPDDKEEDIWPSHCVVNTWGWRIAEELSPKKNELTLQKARYDAFYGTPLEHYLRDVWSVQNLIVVGTVSNICVLHTVGSANLRWLHVIVPADGISALTEFGQALTLHQVSDLYYGDIIGRCKDIEFLN